MTDMKRLAITIGPIADTLNLAKSPAMLWYASACFSRLTFLLCRELCARIPQAQLLSPGIDPETLKTEGYAPDGIGKYHDRILCVIPDASVPQVSMAVQTAKQNLAEMISQDKNSQVDPADVEFLLQYLQVHWVLQEQAEAVDNPILATSPYLDLLEQMRGFNPDNTDNTFLRLFGKQHFRNDAIKHCAMLRHVHNSQLLNGQNFRSIEHIAGARTGSSLKGSGYYAVIQADGDRMGRYLQTMTEAAETRRFSEKCLKYAEEVAQAVGAYGGMTIYAGGDDLLALAPVLGKDGKDIFDLCADIQTAFHKTINQQDGGPTVSIGVAIRYARFPLYEALAAAGDALFDTAKTTYPGKNCLALDWQKNSGQCARLCIPMEQLSYVQDLMNPERKGDNRSASESMETVNSVIYCLDSFQPLLREARAEDAVIELFKNLYDNGGQARFIPYVNWLARKYYRLAEESDRTICICQWDGDRIVKTFEALLRFKKFLMEEEKGAENRDK